MASLIVCIEDDTELVTYLKEFLRSHDLVVKTANTGAAGLKLIETSSPDLVILDLTLPDMNGEGICLEIKKNYPSLPVIILSAKDAVSDKVKSLNIGADDYVSKPFDLAELLARIQARLRATGVNNEKTLRVGDLILDPKTLEVKRGSQEVQLTPQEFKLLQYLMLNPGIVLTREMILNRIWLYSPDVETRVVDVYMGYLRKKIDSGSNKKLLHSLRGFGYTIKE